MSWYIRHSDISDTRHGKTPPTKLGYKNNAKRQPIKTLIDFNRTFDNRFKNFSFEKYYNDVKKKYPNVYEKAQKSLAENLIISEFKNLCNQIRLTEWETEEMIKMLLPCLSPNKSDKNIREEFYSALIPWREND